LHRAAAQRRVRSRSTLWKCGQVIEVSLTLGRASRKVPSSQGRRCVMEVEENAKVYRERAEQARLGAKEATRADFKAVFERLAASCDERARNAEWLEPIERQIHSQG